MHVQIGHFAGSSLQHEVDGREQNWGGREERITVPGVTEVLMGDQEAKGVLRRTYSKVGVGSSVHANVCEDAMFG